MIARLGLIGVGLIGGSLAAALREAEHVREVVGYGRSLSNLEDATRLGLIDAALPSPEAVARASDVVVIAVPVDSIGHVLAQIAGSIAPTTIVTDVGSVKRNVVDAAHEVLAADYGRFVGGHPIAGTERSGAAAARADLFRGRRVVLTPDDTTDAEAVARVQAMWAATGADVVQMSVADHDRILAASSHLPHALAYALVDMLVRMDEHRAIFDCAAGGFRDFTRIAASDPTMWRDIFLANADHVVALLRQYQDDIETLAQAIERGDTQWLVDTLARAKHARDAFEKK
ncbi:MAG: prephenate dehydrogenase [Gammaproteobacteria bacterium]